MMYKVFLVDDEIVIREGIRNNFPWDESGFVLCGEAPDGEIALPMILDLKPDILVTDIRMPFMDGLTLAKKVAQSMPWISIVILSGYDDFEYARQSISLGVKEYMLKPVTAQKLGEVLEGIAVKIAQQRAQQANMDVLLAQLASSSRYAQESVLTRMLMGENVERLLDEAANLHMNLKADGYLVMLLDAVLGYGKIALQATLQRLSQSSGGHVYETMAEGNQAIIVLGKSMEDAEERAYALALALEHEAGQNDFELPDVAIGAPVAQLAELSQALASARAVLRSMKGQAHRIMGSMDVDLSSSVELMEGEILPLHEKLRYASKDEAVIIAETHFAALGDMASQSVLVLNYLLMDVLLAATRIIKQCGGDPAQILPAKLLQQGELLRLSENSEKAMQAGIDMLSTALTFRDTHAFSRYSEILRKACTYIEENFQRQEITLHHVANHVALSNNHFCTVFSQEMGLTFTEYLTNTRMSKAKELLTTTSLRTSDIAYQVGYNDPHYFSYLFKKNTGVSPRDFRKEEK